MQRALGYVMSLVLSVAGAAQDLAGGLAAAQDKTDAKQWTAALEILLSVQEKATADPELEQLAAKLERVGDALAAAATYDTALRAREATLALRKRLHGDRDHPDVAMALNNMAFCLWALGRSDEALPPCEQALAMRRRHFGDRDHPAVMASLSSMALCLNSVGHPEEALTKSEAALAMWMRLYGEADHPALARSLANVAVCLESLGRAGDALPEHEAALAMSNRLFGGADHPELASSLNNVAACLLSLGRAGEALQRCEASLAMRKRLFGEADHPSVASSLNLAALCLDSLGRALEALPQCEAALAMWKRLFGEADHPSVANSLNNVASCLKALGRLDDALSLHEQSLAMWRRLFPDSDHPDMATSLNNGADCLRSLGREREALLLFEQALAMRTRLFLGRDHADVAGNQSNVARCLEALGRAREALPLQEAALAMQKRLFGVVDHPDVASSLNCVALCLQSLGRAGEALPLFEQALAMRRRLFPDRDHPHMASSLDSVAVCLSALGRADDALLQYEAALAMQERLCGEADHPAMARTLNNTAACLESLGRAGEALPLFEQALAMRRRLFRDRGHPDLASSLNNLAFCLQSLGRPVEALPHYEAALAMNKGLFGDGDHPQVAVGLNNVAFCLGSLCREGEALPHYEQALAMLRRLFPDQDHPDVAVGLHNLAVSLSAVGRFDDALVHCAQACDMIEQLRAQCRTSSELRQSLFDSMKSGGTFELMQALARRRDTPVALAAAERSRARDLLDLLELQRFDPLEEARCRAQQRGDDDTARHLQRVAADLAAATLDSDRLLHLLTQLDDASIADADRQARRAKLLEQSKEVNRLLRQLSDERARRLGDVLPVGRVRAATEIQAVLQRGELFLEFTITQDVALLYVLARDSQLEAFELPAAHATVKRELPALLQRSSHEQMRGRDPDSATIRTTDATAASRELFASLIPKAIWERIRASRRVFLAAHRSLHRLPFEVLVTDVKDGVPVHWLESGPAISYVPSGSALHWLRQRASEVRDDATSLDLLVVADPGQSAAEPEVPVAGAFVVSVNDGGEGARVGLQPRDVLLRYDGTVLVDDTTLRSVRTATDAAIEDRQRPDTPIPIEVWRRGETLRLEVKKGQLGIQVGRGNALAAYEASLGDDAQFARVTRAGDLERLCKLPPLKGARAEAQAIEGVFVAHKAKAGRLLGAEATEPAVFDLAAKTKHLHFACHGIAEEYAGQSLSMLVLSQPTHVLPEDDGLLKLGDLLHRWRGRLSSCRLVVLSACRTNVGPTLRDEAPQALPLGFLFAGVPSVISSLWAVDDDSTRELMTDFYSRLLAGETDRLKAFTDAKKALRSKYPDPFHWAPFLFLGSPE